MHAISLRRIWAVFIKEFIQMRRDRLTFGMMVGIPLLQLTLFGFAINSDPKHLPTAILSADHGPFARTLIAAMRSSQYFHFTGVAPTEEEADTLLKNGEVQFVLHIPEDFSRKLLRGERPDLLVEADATDPAATGPALSALAQLMDGALRRDLHGPLAYLSPKPGPVQLVLHRRYNEEGITQYNIVPGLMGVVLTMTMVVITSLAITRESERGTMENLLSTPARPSEVMIGKILPYIAVGYIQAGLILLAAHFLFHVPMLGSLVLLMTLILVFITANLALGITFSTVAQNQLQAMQMSFFFFLPSILLSGFMFPFRGMPEWAQWIGEVLPLTHFLRMVRGILLKSNGMAEVWPNVWPILVFILVVMLVGIKRFRRTLD
ncbi:MAG: ABC transporter permease [Planctomycetes bacterium]|nr:ABC transporter permease [Planctomycetota bacterium]HPF13832.1 ABC transporter permease [Planctomycetota bacterium]